MTIIAMPTPCPVCRRRLPEVPKVLAPPPVVGRCPSCDALLFITPLGVVVPTSEDIDRLDPFVRAFCAALAKR